MSLRDFYIGGVRPFDVNSDPSSVGTEWKRWLRSFQLYADGKGLIIVPDKEENKVQRSARALFLFCAGPDVQDIFLCFGRHWECERLTLHMRGNYSEKWCKGKISPICGMIDITNGKILQMERYYQFAVRLRRKAQ